MPSREIVCNCTAADAFTARTAAAREARMKSRDFIVFPQIGSWRGNCLPCFGDTAPWRGLVGGACRLLSVERVRLGLVNTRAAIRADLKRLEAKRKERAT